jgi:hypothetical protein
MSRSAIGSRLGPPAAVLLVVLGVSCSKPMLHGVAIANERPTVELSQVPLAGDTAGTYVYELSWAGFDADGHILRFQYAVDPPADAGTDTVWVSTTANRHTFVFRADSAASGAAGRLYGFHTVAVIAWDDGGARSAVAFASFTASTVAPTVSIVTPTPSSLLSRELAPAVRIQWNGDDPDGVGTRMPAQYRWKLLTETGDFPREVARVHPDSVRVRYAPAFAGWDSLPGTANSVDIHDLVPGESYTFVVVAIDQAGAYSPVFNLATNMLDFTVRTTATLGPQLTVTSQVFTYTFPSGGILLDPAFYVRGDFAAGVPIPLSWSARTTPGSFIRGYRWVVDIRSVDDETPRQDETGDLSHWSHWSSGTSVVLPAASPASSETHRFFLEAEDDLGLRSLVVVEYTIVRATFSRPLLVVNDTWFAPDHAGPPGCVAPPPRLWPSAAEFDTLLFAVGDKPYKCYAAGSLSSAGIFRGYDYDTLATHFSGPGQPSLAVLGRYRNIIWICDVNSALKFESNPYTNAQPMPLLRDWCMPGNQDRLQTWLLQGGHLWLMGGGAALASLRPYDNVHNGNNVFSPALGELGPGRLMYDGPHWRSEITVLASVGARRSSRAIADSPGVPDYSELPDPLVDKGQAGDPQPLDRTGSVYPGAYAAEYLSQPNPIVEIDPPDPTGVASAALDTLYETVGGDAGTGHPVMTYYHGHDGGSVVFSGFPVWYFQRSQCIQLVDFVLQRIWGLDRQPVLR